jgi:PKD repeat protein
METYSVTNDPSAFYNWTFPATWLGMSTTNSISLTFDNTPGVLSVTADNSCGSSAASTINISLGAAPVAGFTFNINGGALSTTNTSQNANAYVWDFGDGNTSTQTQPTHTYAAPGTYTITLIATNACGGADTTTQVMEVLGTSELDGNMLVIYPNPNQGIFKVEGLTMHLGQNLEFLDVSGRLIAQRIVSDSTISLEIPEAVSGLYFVRVGQKLIPVRIER